MQTLTEQQLADLTQAFHQNLSHQGVLLDVACVDALNDTMAEFLKDKCDVAIQDSSEKALPVCTKALWKRDDIQFPRLICEIAANFELNGQGWRDLRESTDLSDNELNELFDRANAVWEAHKQALGE